MMNRIQAIEEWLFELDLSALSEQEAIVLSDPEESSREEALQDLLRLCQKRYRHNTFWPDFSKIGFRGEKEDSLRTRIFAVGF